ncbi:MULTISPECIES: metal ABC transporter solute-binding protein, Zn/Mn family [Halomonas]|uniref:Zinc ABC transporter substrate-binding protein n=1 Tax=Halomonas casei TaxID=2742613 RepID=A0ABR9F3N1_9GAMM|nr:MULTISPECIES: zinc ABC transporter substrate-binding protein [Halomonas]MBE0401080.1 zinc ABC transporter substrate-binding protein [Halomonas casei]PCC21642.1 manganese transporter [Halomonas sp. JB37]
MKRVVALLGMMSFAPLISANESPLNVVTTIGMIADVAQEVGGQCVEVEAMMGPGVDPHLYQANASDVAMLRQAEQILYAGYSLEGQLGAVLENFSHSKPTLAVGPSGIDPAELMTSQDVYGIDPHLWMDVSLWAQTIPAISDAFTTARPECQASIEANATKYEEQLNALHAWVAESIESIPERRRILVTAHDAFGYYGRAYGIEVEGIQGISTETETGIADIRSMTDVVVEREVPAIFVESTINPRTIQAVIDAARQRGHEVAIGGELYSDAMGDANTADGTYIGMIYANTRHIVEALGGTLAPMPDALSEWAERWEIAE